MKKTLEILSFYTSVPKIMIRSGIVPEIWCATDGWTEGHTDFWTDGWSGGQKKWHIKVVSRPKKQFFSRVSSIL